MIEEIASAYLIEADGGLSLALRQAIEDALADLTDMERRALRAERLISRGFVRARSVVMRMADQGSTAFCPVGDGASATALNTRCALDASAFVVNRTCQRVYPAV